MPDIKKGDVVKHIPTGEIYTVHLLREYVDGWYMSPTCWPALNVPLQDCCALSAHARLAWMAAQAACVETSEPLPNPPTKEHSGVAV